MLPLRIALRYLLSRKSHGAVNIISAVSMAGVAVAAAAMIVVLSVFNGFSQLVERKTSNFNPPLLVKMADGAVIPDADSLAAVLQRNPSVNVASPMIEEQAFAISDQGQMPVTIRAMEATAIDASRLKEILIDGELSHDQATVSVGVAVSLNVRPLAENRRLTDGPVSGWIQVFEPARTGRVNPANPTGAFRGDSLRVAGVYQVEQEEQDRDMLVIPLSVGRDLLDYTTEATAVAVYPLSATNSGDIRRTREAIAPSLPSGMVILDRMEQEADAYRMIAVEKWITFLMLLFILAVASFNIISTLSLMVVEKEKNMGVMSAMGATPGLIKGIFANQGWLITSVGGCAGLIVGSLLTLGQQHFGWIKLNSANPAMMAVDYYPVSLRLSDLLAVAAAILLTSLLIAAVGGWLARPARNK
ncbi:MAG: FtsX-like permease family protein [Muribaculaceae bacterium]|nr:FtsX-like permease family protein [Muribaculaceae bacterium]